MRGLLPEPPVVLLMSLSTKAGSFPIPSLTFFINGNGMAVVEEGSLRFIVLGDFDDMMGVRTMLWQGRESFERFTCQEID